MWKKIITCITKLETLFHETTVYSSAWWLWRHDYIFTYLTNIELLCGRTIDTMVTLCFFPSENLRHEWEAEEGVRNWQAFHSASVQVHTFLPWIKWQQFQLQKAFSIMFYFLKMLTIIIVKAVVTWLLAQRMYGLLHILLSSKYLWLYCCPWNGL